MSWFKKADDKYHIDVKDFSDRNEINHMIDLLEEFATGLDGASRNVFYNMKDARSVVDKIAESSYIKPLTEIRKLITSAMRTAYDNPWSFSVTCSMISYKLRNEIIPDLKEERREFLRRGDAKSDNKGIKVEKGIQ